MTDNIKLPPMPEWAKMDNLNGMVPSEIRTAINEFAREAVEADRAQRALDWSHPKVQALIGSDARKGIQIDLMGQILEDPNQEFGPSDMEYWDTIHDRLKEALSTKPAAPHPAQQERKPLTESAIQQIGLDMPAQHHPGWLIEFARAIERAHGITED